MAASAHNLGKLGTSFTSLSHLFEDFENYLRHVGGHTPHWQPRFDIRETVDTYELYGELPGVTRKDIIIEFTGSETILIQGTVERTYSTTTPPTDLLGDTAMPGVNAQEDSRIDDRESVQVHGAVMENEGMSGDDVGKVEDKALLFKEKYWLTERNIGEFSRSFNFPSHINQQNVKADFKDGILTVIIPKCNKTKAQRILVQ